MPGIAQDLLLDTVTRTGTDTADQGHSPVPTDIEDTVIMTPTEAVLSHIIDTVDATLGVLWQCHHPSVYHYCHDTSHQRSSSHRSSSTHSKDCNKF